MSAYTKRSSGTNIDASLEVAVADAPPGAGPKSAEDVGKILSWYANRCFKGGMYKQSVTLDFEEAPQGVRQRVTVVGMQTGHKPYSASGHARAKGFRLQRRADGDVIAALREMDGPAVAPTQGVKKFSRRADRLRDAVNKANECVDPTMTISEFQMPVPFSFGAENVSEERPLKAPALAQAKKASVFFPDKAAYCDAAKSSIALGDHTHHDPDTLHPRFLEYVHERVRTVDAPTRQAMRAASTILVDMWRSRGCAPAARTFDDMEPPELYKLFNSGSPGEYRTLGATDRRDERLLETISSSLKRYIGAAARVERTSQRPSWIDSTMQPTLTFGKKEPKAAKLVNGERVAPVPRLIFNVSPINYGLAAFLHSDVSKSLQAKDPTHGPGFGPSRGRSGKFLDVVNSHFSPTIFDTQGPKLIMSDILKWDANTCEALLGMAFDTLEEVVDKSSLSHRAKVCRALMVSVARRQLMHKLVEHPSGYFVNLFGCMPSGSFYTSLINTTANNLLVLGHAIDRATRESHMTASGAAAELRQVVEGTLVSYGDNQLFSEALLEPLSLKYDAAKHAEFLARFGMKLKVEETEVSTRLDRVRFCSRGAVMTPYGPLVTRSHTSLYAKLAGRPETDPVMDKLYVRAMMVDHIGTDPVVFSILDGIDSSIRIDLAGVRLTPGVKRVLEDTVKSIFGNNRQESFDQLLNAFRDSSISRRAVLSLHSRAGENLKTSLSFGAHLFDGPLTRAAEWASQQTPTSYVQYLYATGQERIIED
uniref:RdRp n=1 Tax=Phyllosticta capitalensis polymycovirus 2 TaxID=3367396 RepID=A0AB74UFD4_9VIRU